MPAKLIFPGGAALFAARGGLTGAEKTPKTGHMYDVINLGLGGMGAASVYELATAGLKVLGLEQFPRLHDKGSSFGKTRMTRKAYMEGHFYVPLLERAYEKWAGLDALERRPLINLCGGLYCARPGDEVVEGAIASAKAYGIPLEILEAGAIRNRFPVFNPDPDMIGVFDPTAGYVNPEAILDLYFRLAEEAGAELHFSEGIVDIRISGAGIEVETANDIYRGKKLVITAGAWLRRISYYIENPLPLEIRRMVLHWFEPDGPAGAYLPGRFVPNLWRLGDGHLLYGFPWTEEEGGIKYAFHDRYEVVDNLKDLDREVKKAEVKIIRKALQRYAPSVPHRLMASKVCLYTMTPDGHFILGTAKGDPRIILAGGFSGHGFKFVPVIGEIVRDFALERKMPFDLKAFSPERFTGQ